MYRFDVSFKVVNPESYCIALVVTEDQTKLIFPIISEGFWNKYITLESFDDNFSINIRNFRLERVFNDIIINDKNNIFCIKEHSYDNNNFLSTMENIKLLINQTSKI
jgi:hypothetical protein